MAKACERARIKPAISFKILRHTWASHAVMNGVPLLVVAKNLGTSIPGWSRNTTDIWHRASSPMRFEPVPRDTGSRMTRRFVIKRTSRQSAAVAALNGGPSTGFHADQAVCHILWASRLLGARQPLPRTTAARGEVPAFGRVCVADELKKRELTVSPAGALRVAAPRPQLGKQLKALEEGIAPINGLSAEKSPCPPKAKVVCSNHAGRAMISMT
jgi:hypothetical protein